MQLRDKVVVVLGGSGLLGSAIARECAAVGARVVIADIKAPARLPEGARFSQCDALDERALIALAQSLQKEFGRVDGVVNATYPAATRASDNGNFESGELSAKLESVSKNLMSCFTVMRAFVPVMRAQKNGSIIFLSSIYGIAAPRFDIYDGLPMTQPAEYAAAKGGIAALGRYFASRYGRDGIRVNCISPGGIEGGQPKEFIERYSKHVLLGEGLLKPEEIAGTAAFLLSDASVKMTGQNIVVDAGWTL